MTQGSVQTGLLEDVGQFLDRYRKELAAIEGKFLMGIGGPLPGPHGEEVLLLRFTSDASEKAFKAMMTNFDSPLRAGLSDLVLERLSKFPVSATTSTGAKPHPVQYHHR